MAFHWRKLGRVYRPPYDGSWRHSYAQVPTPVALKDRIRVFIGVRAQPDELGQFKSEIAYVDLDRSDLTRIIGASPAPLLPHGKSGTFDEFGVFPIWATTQSDVVRLYYVGWTRMVGVPYAASIGIAESRDGGNTLIRLGDGPLFGRTLQEPYLENGPCVLFVDGLWHMWYGSGTSWIESAGRMESIYVIKHAVSTDSLNWQRDGHAIIPRIIDHECQTSPTVEFFDGRWHMWFCYRYGLSFREKGRGYRIGYAWSDDLITWNRDDANAGFSLSVEGWDDDMACYPRTLVLDDEIHLFYNGNKFGADGFGVARLKR